MLLYAVCWCDNHLGLAYFLDGIDSTRAVNTKYLFKIQSDTVYKVPYIQLYRYIFVTELALVLGQTQMVFLRIVL